MLCRSISHTVAVHALEPRRLLSASVPGGWDSSFSGDGVLLSEEIGMGLLRDVVGLPGNQFLTFSSFNAVRVNANGSVDPTFGTNGRLLATSLQPSIETIVRRPDGKLLAVGGSSQGSSTTVVTRLFSADGVADLSYGVNGAATAIAPVGTSGFPTEFGVLSDGSLLALNRQGRMFHLAADGSLDPAFGGNTGYALVPLTVEPGDILVTDNDGIVVSYKRAQGPSWQPHVMKFTAAGVIDESFNQVFMPEAYQADNGYLSLAARSNGRFVMFTGWGRNAAVVAFNADGTKDITFGNAGVVRPSLDAIVDFATSGVVHPDDSISFAATAQIEPFGMDLIEGKIAHLTADGTRDLSFGDTGEGHSIFDVRENAESPERTLRLSDGSLIVYGSFRLNPDATGIQRFAAPALSMPVVAIDAGILTVNTQAGLDTIDVRRVDGQIRVSVNTRGNTYLPDSLSGISIVAGGNDDAIYIDADLGVPVSINAGIGDADRVVIRAKAGLDTFVRSGGLDVSDASGAVVTAISLATGAERLQYVGTGGDDAVTVEGLPASEVRLDLAAGTDALTLRPTSASLPANATLRVDGAAGVDRVALDLAWLASGAATLAATSASVAAWGEATLLAFETGSVLGSAGDDVLTVRPSVGFAVHVDGGGSAAGDELVLAPTSNVGTATITYDAGGMSGVVQMAAASDVTFARVADVSILGDALGPTVRAASFEMATRLAVTFELSESVGNTIALGDFELIDLRTNTPLSLAAAGQLLITTGADGATIATVLLDPTKLATARYRMVLKPGSVADGSGNTNVAGSGVAFAYSPADTDGNGVSDFFDLLALAQNYGQTGRTRTQGDLNYDGAVNFSDLLIMSQHFGQSAAALLAIVAPPATPIPSKPTLPARNRREAVGMSDARA